MKIGKTQTSNIKLQRNSNLETPKPALPQNTDTHGFESWSLKFQCSLIIEF